MTPTPTDPPTGPADPPGRRRAFADLRVRAASGAALAALAAAALWLGGWAFAALIAAAAGAMTWELRRMLAGRVDAAGWIGVAGAAGAVLATEASMMRFGAAWLLLLLVAAAAVDRLPPRRRAVFAIGAAYVGMACAAYDGLRGDPLYGLEAALWVWLTVVASDVGGYFGGRLIGGPKLWPAVSPKKTWAGLAGGVLLAVLVGAGFSALTRGTLVHEVMIVSAALALVSQAGDILESRVKRACGVKDSSALIPGHGGVLDRMDGLLAAALVAALVTFSRGQSAFIW